jgi:hypothetical protein
MRDLIAKQSAALHAGGMGGSLALYDPERLKGNEQELLPAQGDESVKILKDILSIVKKTLYSTQNIEKSANDILDAMNVSAQKAPITPDNPSLTRASSAPPSLLKLGYSLKEDTARPANAISLDPTAGQAAIEQQAEQTRLQERQISLLEGILAALGGDTKQKAKTKEPDATAAKEGGGIGDMVKGGMKNLFKGILKGILKVGLVGLAAGVVNGLIDGAKVLLAGGSFKDAVVSAFGGLLEFITFGLFSKEDVAKWLDAATEIWDNLGALVDEYIVTPFNNLVENVGTLVNEYIATPITSFIESVDALFTDNVIKPIEAFLSSVTNVFSSIKDSLVNFMTNFEIPKVGVTVFGKEISAGPWKPFAGLVSGGGEVTAAPSAPGGGDSRVTSSGAAAISKPVAQSGNAVYNTTVTNNEMRDSMSTSSSAPVVVSAPTTTVQNKQNIAMPMPLRNPDPSLQTFNRRNAIF